MSADAVDRTLIDFLGAQRDRVLAIVDGLDDRIGLGQDDQTALSGRRRGVRQGR
jgi:hypothetical protein